MKIVNDKKLMERISFTPHPAQQYILDNMRRFTIISAGRRFGKSQLCAFLALRELMASNRNIWIVSPTYDLSQKVFNYISRWIGQYFPKTFRIQSAPHSIVRSPTGSLLEAKSTENKEGLMGEELDLLIDDEASAQSKDIWETYLYPTLANRKGKAMFISTPKGQNWFYRLYQQGTSKEEKNKDYTSFLYSSKDSPHFPISEWENAKRTLPKDIFDQEYRAIFLSDAASVFRNVNECAGGVLKEPEIGHLYVMGVDLGKFQDFTVITIIDLTDHNIVYLDRFQTIPYPLQKRRIVAAARKYHDAIVTLDATGQGIPIADDLEADGLTVNDYQYTNKSKSELISKLSIYIEQNRITYPPDEILIDELRSFGYTKTKAGRFQYGAPEGQHDDMVNSLALAVWELSEHPLGESVGEIFLPAVTDY
uniref:Putative terminase n=1 Tax=viral metagenome TaxID=1070528 RepID=A0A6M3K8B2_9ZZZZ